MPDTGVALVIDDDHGEVSATAVRAGATGWMLPEAHAFAERTGAWIDPDRYRATSTAPCAAGPA